ncbi:MAG: F510_1955 family glycosylhydrolase [bacterium]
MTQARGSRATWWVLGVAAFVVAAGGSAIYLVRSGATAAPHEAAVDSFPHVHGLAVDPTRPGVLWIGAHGSLVRVTDGKQWARVGRQNYDMMGFTAHPREPNVLLTSGHPGPGDPRPNPLGVEISRDSGQTWQPLGLAGEADFHAMAISRADPKVLYAWNVSGRVGLYRSRDGGRQWEYLGLRGLDRVFYLAAHPGKASVVYAGTIHGLYVSEDAGETWRVVSPVLSSVPVTAVEVHATNPKIMYAYAAKPELGLIRSEDGGKQWTSVGFFLGERDAVGNVALHPNDPQTLYFATYNSDLYRSRDGGRSREPLASHGKVVGSQ